MRKSIGLVLVFLTAAVIVLSIAVSRLFIKDADTPRPSPPHLPLPPPSKPNHPKFLRRRIPWNPGLGRPNLTAK